MKKDKGKKEDAKNSASIVETESGKKAKKNKAGKSETIVKDSASSDKGGKGKASTSAVSGEIGATKQESITDLTQAGLAKKAKKRKSSSEEEGEGVTVVRANVPVSMTVTRQSEQKLLQSQSAETPVPMTKVLAKNIPTITVKAATPETSSANTKASDKLEEGEVEIFIPNKKYRKGSASSTGSDFAKFDGSKPPVAFVKHAYNKVNKTPKTPKTPVNRSTTSLNARTRSETKRVSFDMKKNKAQGRNTFYYY